MKYSSILADSLVSPLGNTSEENFNAIKNGQSAIHLIEDDRLSSTAIFAGRIQSFPVKSTLTRFEALSQFSIQQALAKITGIDLKKTVFILATTKGNIEMLENGSFNEIQISLHSSAHKIAHHFGIARCYVVSTACTSGVMALLVANRLMHSGNFNHAIVTGTDVLSRFIISGFQSLHALSDEPCKPFDVTRKGLNLGEASATMILSIKEESNYLFLGGSSTNDANHISGPSKTGEELGYAICNVMASTRTKSTDIDFISAHGTATLYNDEMEAKAFEYAQITGTPVNSLKGYFGHTLGAAGLVEMAMSVQSLRNNTLIPTKGFSKPGTSVPLNIITKPDSRPLQTFLKTASGFGGCNAAVMVKKIN